jgi:hypothetical protein
LVTLRERHGLRVSENRELKKPFLPRAINGSVYTGIQYRNLFLFLNFIPALTNIYIYLSLPSFLTIYPCFAK